MARRLGGLTMWEAIITGVFVAIGTKLLGG
jgi:hypothetical protein